MEDKINNEKRLATMEQKIDNLTDKVQEIASDIKDHIKWEAEKYEKLDTKYSAKWVETGVVAIITSIIIAAIVGLGTYFFKH
jgi:hypothetical protein